jgi:hypothetical protein
MSFRILARGTNGFIYQRNNQPDGDIFVAADVVAALRASGPSYQGAAEGVADYVLPSEDGALREVVRHIAEMTFLPILRDSVSLLATCTQAHEGWISVSTHQSRNMSFMGGLGIVPLIVNPPRPERNAFASYNFAPGNNPGAEFVQAIAQALHATGMNNYGVLRVMSIALSQYWDRIGRSARPMIQIHLYR